AYIEWEAGRERLFVATRTEPSQGPALWVVPIPSPPAQVAVEPVQVFPSIGSTTPYVNEARDHLKSATALTATLDTGFLLCPVFLGKNATATFSQVKGSLDEGVTVHQHIEKLGLVAEVLTARDLGAFDRYLRGKEIGASSKDIVAL